VGSHLRTRRVDTIPHGEGVDAAMQIAVSRARELLFARTRPPSRRLT